ncbi:MAG: transposase, partial [Desulfobulbaceae bacterium A2]
MNDSANIIPQMDILRSFLGLLCLGKSDFEALSGMQGDAYFQQAMGIKTLPSVERLRQRMDETADRMIPVVHAGSLAMLKRAKVPISGLTSGHVPLDIDVFPQDNSGTKKEGVSWTYKKHDGYAPIAAYLG